MDTRNAIYEKSFHFAVRIVRLYQHLCAQQKEFTLSRQLLRCGTSIGANIAEAQQAQSHADFISKLSISLKETSETKYWLRLMQATGYLTQTQAASLLTDCSELEALLVTILKKLKNRTES